MDGGLKEEQALQERTLPQGAQSLIAAYEQYCAFVKNFQKLEVGDLDVQGLDPHWRVIKDTIERDKSKVKHALTLTQATTPEKLGQALYEAKDKFDDSPPSGRVRAFCDKSYILIQVNNED